MKKIIVLLILFLLVAWTVPCVAFQQNSTEQQSAQLNEAEKRRILAQLYELQSARQTLVLYSDYIKRLDDQAKREQDLCVRTVDLEKKATALAEKERDLYKDQANTWQQMYKVATKKPGWTCILKRIVTLGLGRCK